MICGPVYHTVHLWIVQDGVVVADVGLYLIPSFVALGRGEADLRLVASRNQDAILGRL